MKFTKEMNGKSVDIYSCYEYDKGLVRDVCHDIKENHHLAMSYAALKMANVIESYMGHKRYVLVPIPSRSGIATTNSQLCAYLKDFLNRDVCDILVGNPRESAYEIKKRNPEFKFTKDFFGFRLRKDERLHVILVDNVFDTGATCTFASELFDRVSVLTFAHTKKTFECG